MQVGGGDAGGFGDDVDFRLRAPVAADMRDGAAHHVIIGGGGRQRREVGEAGG